MGKKNFSIISPNLQWHFNFNCIH